MPIDIQIIANLVRFDLLLPEDLAHRALDQLGETFVPTDRAAVLSVNSSRRSDLQPIIRRGDP